MSSSQSDLESFSFGDTPDLADELAALVVAGVKTATCWPASQDEETFVGNRRIVLDGRDDPVAVVETVELFQCRFDAVDEAFARDEGEGDRTLAWWREAHRAYFERHNCFAPDMLLWCERFRVVKRFRPGSGAVE